ncbi:MULTISPECIES: helix-turn-helix domain-containing protein [unclassified Rathayibacter]|uniref:winged helix-turn-helix transcriptional regulator n=1 Tax=unclassified Rathayibacter TaxID=2609250 RepID=UPI001FB41E9E|nr:MULTISPECIES: helix-turn-helix domain-containing protein [unclassified Rathayibacter]MCJ1672446.1 helix-turn-helix transcriptional regulator [Rathayibacter sp. VKM Ac-2929]MCJ1684978.1 helix-turn-helix transcriptional regulator [Rathayibacter sp. VKM Ac-2928]
MPTARSPVDVDDDRAERCSVARSLELLGERWSLLIVREALRGASTYSEFRERLGVPSDVLSARLRTLTEAGVFEKVPYRPEGSRERSRYELTEQGRALKLVLVALAQWGDENRPAPHGAASLASDADSGERLELAFVDREGRRSSIDRVRIVPGPAARTTWESL